MKLLWKNIKTLDYKQNPEQIKMDFYSVLIPTILSREVFNKNKDVKELVDKFKVKKKVKDYLYISRTALLARLIREIEDAENDVLQYNVKMFKEYVEELLISKGLINYDSTSVTKIINKYSRNQSEKQK
ncbi:hypothetical protein [Bacillus sp. GB_SG_008]|uniref:hypothetical protein n=1 Tax=Bacillus sp. GB_SG_008 TaxID=3454627 RepID=UPI003F85ADD0